MAGQTTRRTGSAAARPHLVVIVDGVATTHPLPESGQLVFGRDAGCDVRIDHASISRRHARLHVGPTLSIEDLGSANGTRTRDGRLAANQPAAVTPGEVIEVGAALVILQQPQAARRNRRIWSHGFFEARLEDECARAEATGAGFAVVRIRCLGNAPGGLVEDQLAGLLREQDVLGAYAPGEHELLLPDCDATEAAAAIARIGAALDQAGLRNRVGGACFPRDGRSPHLLFATACAAVRDPAPPPAAGDRGPVLADAQMQRLYRLVERIAAGDLTVLVLGETGTGKELVAEAIHRASPRRKAPLLKLNCAALPEALLESELFGHERGAFTGAVASKPGLLESADGGTVFLDEIGDLPAAVQVKLLRVLEDRKVTRVGGLTPRAIDVRFVAATHRDLEAEVAAGRFRHDLLYRLGGLSVTVPPLRERTADIAPLVRAFAAQAAAPTGRPVPEPSPETLALLERYHWPGNVRELRNLIERAVLLASGPTLTVDHLPVDKLVAPIATAPTPQPPAAPPPGGEQLRRDLAGVERQHILDALARCGGNQTEAARLLGVSRRTLSSKLDLHGIVRPRKGR